MHALNLSTREAETDASAYKWEDSLVYMVSFYIETGLHRQLLSQTKTKKKNLSYTEIITLIYVNIR